VTAGLAFLATAVATLFAEATLVRWTRGRQPYHGAWTISLAMFAAASAALATGASTGWDRGTFRAFYLFGAVLNVPWLALGTVYLLAGDRTARRVRTALLLFTGLAAGVMLAAPMHGALPRTTIPVGKRVFGVLPRVLAAAGSGLGALIVFGGAVSSAFRYLRARDTKRRAAANGLIALGTLVLSTGGTLQGVIGKDTAFVITLAVGITVIYSGFLIAA
jgi:hypothetical protein